MIRNPTPSTTLASRIPVMSAAAVDAAMVTIVPRPTAAPPARRGRRDGNLRLVRNRLAFQTFVVGIHHALRFAANRVHQAGTVVVKAAHFRSTKYARRMLAMPLGEFSRDRLPLSKVLVDKPVDQFRDAPLDLSRGIGDDLVFEFLLNARAVQQVGEAPESKRLFEKTVAASFHVGKNLLDRGDAQLEPAFHVVAVYGQLPLDVAEQLEVVVEDRQTLPGDRGKAVSECQSDAERIGQLQSKPVPRIKRVL